MPPAPIPPDVSAFLRDPHPAVVATVRPDGSPQSVPTWYGWEDGRVLLNMDEGRSRLAWLRCDNRISLTVIDRSDFYRYVSLVGRVTTIEEDHGLVAIDRLAHRYTGQSHRHRGRRRYNAWMEIDRWHGRTAAGPWPCS